MMAGRLNGNVLTHWMPIGAALVGVGVAFGAGAAFSSLQSELAAHRHPRMEAQAGNIMAELGTIKEMVARIDERTKQYER